MMNYFYNKLNKINGLHTIIKIKITIKIKINNKLKIKETFGFWFLYAYQGLGKHF